MAHQSDNSIRLRLREHKGARGLSDISWIPEKGPAVYTVLLPFAGVGKIVPAAGALVEALKAFACAVHPESTIAILTSPGAAANLWIELEPLLRFQLWVAVKLARPVSRPGQLPQHHAALLVLTRYKNSLRHVKTRIAYTYCPACDKTTKDYGGKKHTYHEYGTLMSDVWRDVAYDPDQTPTDVLTRLRDVFGVAPYETLHLVDLRRMVELRPAGESPARAETTKSAKNAESQLLQGDCLELLKSLDSESVDFCFADPPYNLDKKYDSWNDALDVSEYFSWCDQWLDELARVLRPGRTCAILNIPQWAVRHFAHMRNILRYQGWIAWEGLSLPVRMIMPAHYSIVCFSKGAPRPLPGLQERRRALEETALSPLAELFCLRSTCVDRRRVRKMRDTCALTDLWWDIHRLKHNSRRVDHPCQLPPSLMRRLIALFTCPGEVVLDPFNGAGTTTLAAEQLGRRFIGIELSERYHSLASRRHEELRSGLDPFRKTDTVPGAKNSRVKRLEKQRYHVCKKELQLEVKRLAAQLGHLPKREDVQRMSQFPLEYFEKYFISWGEVCAAARTTGMSEYKPGDPRAKRSLLPLFSARE